MGEDPSREESSNDDRSANGDSPQSGGDDPSKTEATPITESDEPDPTTGGETDEDAERDDGSDDTDRADEKADGHDAGSGDREETDDAENDDAENDDAENDDAENDDAESGDAENDETEDQAEDEGPETDESTTDKEDDVDGSVTEMEGPKTDQEMPLADHIEEMMRRLGLVFLVGGIALVIAFPSASELINYFWSYHIPEPNVNRPRLYGPLELVLTRIKVAGLAGVVLGLPVFVYQTYRFMRPGLYRGERRYYLAAVPTSLILGGIGILFAHFLVLPAIFSYFTTYTSDAATIAFGLKETFNLIVVMMSFMAIVFQIPLFIMLAIMMNLVTRQWLEDKRLIFWGTFLGIAFLFSPDPTGMAPIIVTLTMIVLYEGTLALLRWTGN
ncbi:sec-independent protein translocase protein TatC [Halopenitus malekzadehii]|uniref:Sec-independent protein translocase protein TatC n=1 Tax=Halopenitus malekzadehii TaxID=1267564 RepID=A0A1H6HRK1_9EURY|nr:twin-arginine translocase subunit TatC [Halopenitus malekzadehii]SEH36808.1 sec-independent protein translocase protein TatC [Halopenitus malekzadehii]